MESRDAVVFLSLEEPTTEQWAKAQRILHARLRLAPCVTEIALPPGVLCGSASNTDIYILRDRLTEALNREGVVVHKMLVILAADWDVFGPPAA